MLVFALILSNLFFEVCSTGNAERVMDYIEAGASLEARDENGRTALMCAAQDNPDPKVIIELIRGGANVDARGRGKTKWQTPLMLASAHNKNPEVIVSLLNAGAAIEARDADGFTSVMLAKIYNPNPDIAKLLIRSGAIWTEPVSSD